MKTKHLQMFYELCHHQVRVNVQAEVTHGTWACWPQTSRDHAPNTAWDVPTSILLCCFQNVDAKCVLASASGALCWEICGWSLIPIAFQHSNSLKQAHFWYLHSKSSVDICTWVRPFFSSIETLNTDDFPTSMTMPTKSTNYLSDINSFVAAAPITSTFHSAYIARTGKWSLPGLHCDNCGLRSQARLKMFIMRVYALFSSVLRSNDHRGRIHGSSLGHPWMHISFNLKTKLLIGMLMAGGFKSVWSQDPVMSDMSILAQSCA